MRTQPIDEDTACRLAKALMVRHRVSYDDALEMLARFRLNLICDRAIESSASLQAALLTAINTGKRAFHGGVNVTMPANVPCIIPWSKAATLNAVAEEVGAEFSRLEHLGTSHTLYFGAPVDAVPGALVIVCTGWRGGVAPVHHPITLGEGVDFALGGVLAASLGVAKGFLRLAGLSVPRIERPVGASIWRPDLDWTSPQAEGPPIELLPKRLWLLGLGHLGQAYVWNLSLLPYPAPAQATFLLQDFERAVPANQSAGLLCDENSSDRMKTRLCAEWLERRGIQTMLTERPFDMNTRRGGEEPFVALCGFDSAKPRSLLADAGFDLIVECGIGGTIDSFDQILLHTFPDASRTPAQIWAAQDEHDLNPVPADLLNGFVPDAACGVIAETLAKKSISASFVGAFAGAMVVGELLRGLHGGSRSEIIKAHLRGDQLLQSVMKNELYQERFARSGYTPRMIPGNCRGQREGLAA